MMDIGTRLREAREQQNLSLEQLQETTKIQKRYLAAIEENKFNVLPGKFYAKAFLKEYANAVGVDSKELLDQFEGTPPEEVEEKQETEEYTRINQPTRERSRNTGSLLPKITVFLLIIAILVLAVVFYQKTASNSTDPVKNQDGNEIIRSTDDDENDAKATEEKKEKAAEQKDEEEKAATQDKADKKKKTNEEKKDKEDKDKQKDVSFTVAKEGTGNSPESTVDIENAGDQAKVVIESAGEGESWLDVKSGTDSKFSGSFTKDSSPVEVELASGDELYMIIGSAPALNIKVNGKKMEYPADPNEKVFQKIHLKLKDTE